MPEHVKLSSSNSQDRLFLQQIIDNMQTSGPGTSAYKSVIYRHMETLTIHMYYRVVGPSNE